MKSIFTIVLSFFLTGSAISAEKSPDIIILLGAPASGKGTQAKFITEELKIPHISTGDLFRENIKKQTKLGIEAQKDIHEGKLVPDSLVLDMLFNRIAEPDAQKGYLLDGFPRTVSQAEAYGKHLGKEIKPLVICIEVSDKILLERIEAREKAEKRVDDNLEVAKNRLKIYHEQTSPLIAYYKTHGDLHQIQGDASVEEIRKQIATILKKH